MSSIDSLSDIVLGNVVLPAEDEAHIVPFLKRIEQDYGTPIALVHDMGKGILSAAAKVFPDVPEFICHFHFLRDIGKDYMGAEYDVIRKRLSAQGIGAKLRYRAKGLKTEMDKRPGLIRALETAIGEASLPEDVRGLLPVVNTYTLIQWVLQAKSEGCGYGFPFDHPHLTPDPHHRKACENVPHLDDPPTRLPKQPTGAEPEMHPHAACFKRYSPKPRWYEIWRTPPT